ncbi:MAG TPA: ABC transporter permease [Puia sp.]|nr:ABC transporter permease [Puia sp.]
MLKIYLSTAIRHLIRNKAFTLLNIIGLALGLATCMLMLFYVRNEWSYDRWNEHADRIVRINTEVKFGASVADMAQTSPPMGPAMVRQFPEVEKAVRLLSGETQIKKGDEWIGENRITYADPSLFEVFTLPLIKGDSRTALNEPHSIVISEDIARKYFGVTDIVGRELVLKMENRTEEAYRVTGVMEKIPVPSHFHFDIFLSMKDESQSKGLNFNVINMSTYLLLRPGVRYKDLEAKMGSFMRNALSQQPGGWDMDAFERDGNYMRTSFTPLTEIHLHSHRLRELEANGSAGYISIFSAVALFVLLMACINFINLSTARSANRSREVGIRKVLGSSRSRLMALFLSESALVTLVASLLALAGAWALLPLFNKLSGKDLTMTLSVLAWWAPLSMVLGIGVGLLAGVYPALFLSSFQPVRVLKGRLATGFRGSRLRTSLVALQFTLSISLIFGTLVIHRQLHYIESKDLGFDRDHVLVIKNVHVLERQQLVLKEEALRLPGVASATLSSFLPTGERRWANFLSADHHPLQTEFWPVDEDYISTMGMQLKTGRSFLKNMPTDSTAVVINEAAAASLDHPSDALHGKIYYGNDKEYHIIGVVKNFHFSSLRDPISPVVMPLMQNPAKGEGADALSIRIRSADVSAVLAAVRERWKTLSRGQQFEYSFMDEDFDGLYHNERQMGQVFIAATALAIVVACLGLLGLAAYAAEQRTREISIRKVLGAGVSSIVGLLSKEFLRPVFISMLIAFPVAWMLMHRWLQDFAYRTNIPIWIMGVAGLAAIIVAALAISYQSIRAARVNPVESLRTE